MPPAPVAAPVVPWACCSTHDVLLTALPAVKVGLLPLEKLVRYEVDAHDEPAPPAPAPSAGRRLQLLLVPLPPPA